MKLAYRAYFATLLLLMLAFAASAQSSNARSDKDRRNTAPTVGTGGSVGGPTGLFTVYDGETLRKGEYTLSAAISNYDRDPGNVDITSYPLSFQIGLSDKFELFFTTEAYRTMKINSPRNLSGFYLPNSQILLNGSLRSAPAIVLSPQGSGTSLFPNTAVFRPTGFAPFVQYPFTGGNAGTFGLQAPFFSGPMFGFPTAGSNALLGPPVATNGAASAFPGVGSVYGSILPGVVLRTIPIPNTAGAAVGEGPSVFTTAPSYLPEAPFANRIWADSAFNNWDIGFKWRANNINSAIGWGFSAFYRWNVDRAHTQAGFNQLQRGSGTGGNRGDIGVTAFATARLAEWANLSANVGLTHVSSTKADYANGTFTLLDLPDEFHASIGADFPVNKYFQIITELSSTKYIGGRTPNAFENNPLDGIAGIRIFPRRWLGLGLAYRRNLNQQSDDSFDTGTTVTVNTINACRPGFPTCVVQTIPTTFSGVPPGFVGSTDPNGYIFQMWVGRRNKRATDIVNQPGVVESVTLGTTTITLPCRPGTRSRSGACGDVSRTVSVATRASDPEGDVLTYNYTVSGGRIVGSGANVTWDLAGAQTGTYTITTGVDDGCGVCGKTDTKTITIRECPDCEPIPQPTPDTCRCGQLSVTGPGGVTDPGNTMTFTATYSGGSDVSPTYNWTVSAGTIESGQGTPSITVRTTSGMGGQTVTATVELGNLCGASCPRTMSESGPIATVIQDIPEDVYEGNPNVPDDEVKAWVDAYYIKLNNNPTYKGYIINYGTPAQIAKRERQIEKAVTFRKYDRSKFVFIKGGAGTGVKTRFIIVPANAAAPNP